MALLTTLVGDPERFNREHWGRRSLHRSSGQAFDHLLSIARIEEFLGSAARQPTFRLVREGVTLPAKRSTRPMRLGGRQLDDVADLEAIGEAMHDGATLVLQSLQRTLPEIAGYCRSLEHATSHPVQANAYLTPKGAAGLSPHSDEHDVFVLQIVGPKHWDVEDLGEVRIEPGDVLYLPRGTRHSATAQETVSLHLTIGVLSVTWASVLRRTLDRSVDDELLRPLPLGFGRADAPDQSEELAGMIARAASRLLVTDASEAMSSEAAASRQRRRPWGGGHLSAVLELDQIGPAEIIRARRDVDFGPIRAADGRVRLRLVDRRLTFPATMGPALDRVATGEEVAVGDLPGLSDGSRLVLVRRLIREMLVELVEHPTESGRSD